MDYPHEHDLRQITRPDGRRVLESWIAGDWRELVGIEIVGTRLQDGGSTAHLTLSVKLPCVITMKAPTVRCLRTVVADDGTVTQHMQRIRPLNTDTSSGPGFPIALTRADLDAAKSTSFADDAAALADEIAASSTEPCTIVIEEDGSPTGVTAQAGFEELKPSATEGVPSVVAEQTEWRARGRAEGSLSPLPGDELIEPRGGRYPAKRHPR